MLMLTQYYPPEPGAASVRLQAMARELVGRGWTVKVVTAFPHHLGYRNPRYRGRFWVREADQSIVVVRTWIWVVPTGKIWHRLLNYFSFVVTSFWGLVQQGRADYLLVESPPLFLGITAWVYARLKRIPYILSVSDLWPESAVALGLVTHPVAIRLAEALERFLYRHAHRVSAVTEGIAASVEATGAVLPHRILFAPNGVDLERFGHGKPDPALRERLGLGQRHIFLYPGTLGYAQGLEVIIEAADLLRHQSDIVFLLVGDGPVKDALRQSVIKLGLSNVVFQDLQPVEHMPTYFAMARAVVVPLRKHPLFLGARPSKVFPAWAEGIPVIFSGAGEMAKVVEQSRAGVTVPPGDSGALAMAVELFARMSDAEVRQIGAAGRVFVQEHYTWARIMDRWLQGLIPRES